MGPELRGGSKLQARMSAIVLRGVNRENRVSERVIIVKCTGTQTAMSYDEATLLETFGPSRAWQKAPGSEDQTTDNRRNATGLQGWDPAGASK